MSKPKKHSSLNGVPHTGSGRVDHIFVYGTLRSRAKAPERKLLATHGTRIGIGRVESASLHVGEYPYAVPVKNAGGSLVGEVYRFDASEMPGVLAKLDAYEEYDPNDIKGSLYRRETVRVRVGDTQLKAWIYWYNRPLGNIPSLSHGNYLKSQLHVVPSATGWDVKVAGTRAASVSVNSKVEAVRKARKLAGKNHMMLVIHGRDGRIQERIPREKA
jgi:gamma-glutamylcyclotransferase (GGCT)/AIG2-like uncharacterized protein YtfP